MSPAEATVRLAPRQVVQSGLCVGCGGCAAQAQAVMAMDRHGLLVPRLPVPAWREASERFAQTCPASPAAADEDQLAGELYRGARQAHVALGRFESSFVGAVAEGEYRLRGSSGGMVSWVAAELLRQGLVDGVAHVHAVDPAQDGDGRFFRYRISRSVEEVQAGAKSRYYPVELSGVLQEMRERPGRYAVVGIPCFIKAVQLLRRQDTVLHERIAFTLGLFCGHMKSARFIESFAFQLQAPMESVRQVEYRLKDPGRPANWYTVQMRLRDGRSVQQDWFHLAEGDWGSGFFQNPACNFCDDVVAETADISFGDAWVEPYSQDGRGTNVVVVRSPLLARMIEAARTDGRLALAPVDGDFVANTQAAGLRQRREGLAYRLAWSRPALRPRKRVAPGTGHLPLRRKLIYRMRAAITAGSHALFPPAAALGWQRAYLAWARGSVALYHGLAYSRGRVGSWLERLGLRPDR